jgi:hypothetical protein
MTKACLVILDETPARAGQMILSMARRVRQELSGQVPGIPDLTGHDTAQPMSILVWEAMPELARRLFRRDGIMVQLHDNEVSGDVRHITDVDLRWIIAQCLSATAFRRAARELRLQSEITGVGHDQALVADLIGRAIEEGNPVEIASGKLLSSAPEGDPDPMTQKISDKSLHMLGRRGFTWQHDLSPTTATQRPVKAS